MISANGGLLAHRYTPQVTQRWPPGSEPASRLNRPGRNAKTLRDLREEVQRLLQRYALDDIDSWSPRLRTFVLEEPSLLNWVYNS